MKMKNQKVRKFKNHFIVFISTSAAVIGIFFLLWIISEVAIRGIGAINFDFFTSLPPQPGEEGGGLSNALLGTLIITLIATIIGVPIGLLGGIYLSEFAKDTRFGGWSRFATNVMMGIPSIIIGLFVYSLIVLPTGHFSGFAGAVALSIIMLPVVGRTTEDILNLVPSSLRESALALGAPRWKVTIGIVFRAAKSGLITGIILSVARISGETAPLLFTALNSPYLPYSINEPTANLTVTIYNYSTSPFSTWQELAWGASLIIMLFVLFLNIISRIALKEAKK